MKVRLDTVRCRVQAARNALTSGHVIDLTELAGEVEAACKSLSASPLQMDRMVVAQDIKNILVELDQLEQELTAQHDGADGDVD